MKHHSIENRISLLLFFAALVSIVFFCFSKATTKLYDYINDIKGNRETTEEISNGVSVIQAVPIRKGDLGLSFIFSTGGHRVSEELTVRAVGETSRTVYIDQTIFGKTFKNNEFMDFYFPKDVKAIDETLFVTFTASGEPGSGPMLLTTGSDSIPGYALTINGIEKNDDLSVKRITIPSTFTIIFCWCMVGIAILIMIRSIIILHGKSSRDHENLFYFIKVLVVLYFFGIAIYFIHIPMGIISDDAISSPRNQDLHNVFKNIKSNYFGGAGRFMTDGLAFLLYLLPFSRWKILDTFAYEILLILLWRLFSDRSVRMLIACSVFILLFPIYHYMTSAGYIVTTTNYVYTIIGLLAGLLPLIKVLRNESLHPFAYILIVLGILYAANHDQSALIMLGVTFILSAVYFRNWKFSNQTQDKRKFVFSIAYFLFAAAAYMFTFLSPGHLGRMTSNGELFWLPQYVNWSFRYKIYRGITSTFANIFFLQPVLFQLYCLLLLAVVYIRNRGKVIFPVLLTGIMTFIYAVNKDFFITYYPYSVGLPDFYPIKERPLALILSVFIVIFLFSSILSLWKSNRKLSAALFVLVAAGFGSRFIMGMSVTIYASSFRTFTALLFCIIVSNILMLGDVFSFIDKEK